MVRLRPALRIGLIVLLPAICVGAQEADRGEPGCAVTVRAHVVALDQGYLLNRLGTSRPGGLLFALAHDVTSTDDKPGLRPGKVRLRESKRPRPIVLRVNAGDCLDIRFQNLLAPKPTDPNQPVTRDASLHVAGLNLRRTIGSDGVRVGANPEGSDGVVPPGGEANYALYAPAEGAYLLYSTPGDYNNFGTQQLTMGLFGAINVEPRGSEWYRSQVTAEDLRLATLPRPLPDGHPRIDYDARYPAGYARAGLPILRMLDRTGSLVHSDLTAVITGPGRGPLPGGPGTSPILPERDQPFREVTVHYHESQDVVQAFPYFYDQANRNVPTVNAGQDSFAINYGVAGIGPEVLANRLGVGPTAECAECKFEEFFLSSWAQGDPGLVVDVPANAPCTTAELEGYQQSADGAPPNPCQPDGKQRATRAFYPDDPSNVYHSYLGDHVRFRILHAGAAVHHVHHHHAHQWLHQAQSDGSNYLDSQSIGPGSSYSLELVYDGSGNRNLTAGDSIFHCHFYPHFASGMWALFRVHDAFEAGTRIEVSGRPRQGARALPDAEIAAGTPIPAVVPLPTRAMAPLPSPVAIVDGQVRLTGDGFPGYPFYIPGQPGHRPPHPPLDFAIDPDTRQPYDGGLPRHIVTSAVVANEQHTTLDWSKDLQQMTAVQLPELGTRTERGAMKYFGQHLHKSFTPEGRPSPFRVNGLPRGSQPGAPFADPAVIDGQAVGGEKRVYKGVNLQLDTVFNKAGWHYPQQRMMALWGDVADLVAGRKPPEPLFFRAASNDVVEYWHTNLVPAYYELDDFQVRTPTDILGQHIHLVKFDVTSSDGAANGFNYEDGTFSPEEVRERIDAINATGGLWDPDRKGQTKLQPKPIPALGAGPGGAWLGAQATVQRWWIDPLMDTQGTDRTYMTVFTHDHFGPSTHQMIGLYGGLLVEPRGTSWTSIDGKTRFRARDDGGPTSYAANILYDAPGKQKDNYREFALAWGDLQLAYGPGSRTKPDCYSYTYKGLTYGQAPPLFDCIPPSSAGYRGWSDPTNVINCPRCQPAAAGNTASAPNPPTPFMIADFGAGMISLNYRNEPLPLRIRQRASGANSSAEPEAADLAHAFRSIPRSDPAFSVQPAPGAPIDPWCGGAGCFRFPQQPISGGMQPFDPFTPLLSGYEGDKVQIRLLSGSHTSMHDFAMNGQRWRFEPFSANSGYRSGQFIVLSEHFETLFDLPATGAANTADYLYNPTASYEGLTNGIWGLLRSYKQPQPFVAPLRRTDAAPQRPTRPPANLSKDCAKATPCLREFEVHAMTAQQAMGGAPALIYNARGVNLGDGSFDGAHPLVDPLALVYVLALPGQPYVPPAGGLQPLVLRAAAGDWIHVKLVNELTGREPVFSVAESASRWAQIPYAFPYAAINLTTSAEVGLHAQLVDYDVTASDGANVGLNPVQTAPPGKSVDYYWYAGKFEHGQPIPVEYGVANLMPADPLMQVYRGLFGALVIEPAGATWVTDPTDASAATVWHGEQVFREFVLATQNDVNVLLNQQSLYLAGTPLSAFNYRTEPFFSRFGKQLDGPLAPNAPSDWRNLTASDLANISGLQFSEALTTQSTANSLVGGDPLTPILRAPAGMAVRLRVLSPGGIGDNQQVFELSGHSWQEEPYTHDSTRIGWNARSNSTGTISGLGPATKYEIVLADGPKGENGPAGGHFRVPGDYLYRSWTANQFQAGLWGIFRVAPWNGAGLPDTVGVTSVARVAGEFEVSGFTTVSPQTRTYASSVSLALGGQTLSVPVSNGRWSYRGTGTAPAAFRVTSPLGGVATFGAASAQLLPHAAAEAQLLAAEPGAPETQRRARKRRALRPRQPR